MSNVALQNYFSGRMGDYDGYADVGSGDVVSPPMPALRLKAMQLATAEQPLAAFLDFCVGRGIPAAFIARIIGVSGEYSPRAWRVQGLSRERSIHHLQTVAGAGVPFLSDLASALASELTQ
ncbi:MAG: hypothetical protein U7M05_12240 [Candidatus Igneacidithiobacillus chanchocoensis]